MLDSTDLILQCFHHSWETVCGFYHSREALVQTFGTPLRAAMHRLLKATEPKIDNKDVLAKTPDTEDVIDQLLTAYRAFNAANHDKLARPFEGTGDVLKELRRRGYLIGVVTSKTRELALRGLRLCSLEELIDSGVFLEDTERHKPNPEPILAALKNLSRPSNTAAYVGDSPHDIAAARAAGVLSVAALWGPASRTALERENPDLVAESIGDLLEVFA
ncbi:MAG TPA: HAD-IA family hydrolase [Blastocatellia bacterium]|nr:HAD-IA family hydrolase [Blastocatellia bacterium]